MLQIIAMATFGRTPRIPTVKEGIMRRRLYFLLPDLKLTHQVVDELLLARIEQHHIHVIAREDMATGNLPQATLLQRSDIVHGMELGLVLGGVTGVLGGAIALLLQPDHLHIGWGTLLLACGLGGALIGAWAASMIGTSVPNSSLRDFQRAIEQGQVLLMVDVPRSQVDRIGDQVTRLHPEATSRGMEPTIPAFP